MALVVVACVGLGGPAHADGSSVATVGVGTGVGIRKAESGAAGDAETAFLNPLEVRVKLLQMVGLDLAYDLAHGDGSGRVATGELQYGAQARLNVLLYPYAGEHVALYLGAGTGGTSLGELFQLDAAGNSYQAGFGLEAHIDDHIAIDASFYLIAPGRRSVENQLEARVEAAIAARDTNVERPSWTDYVSLANHEFMVRLFLFL